MKTKLSDVFREAKQHLWNGTEEICGNPYICHAIDKTYFHQRIKEKAKDVLMTLLDGNYTLSSWLYSQGITINGDNYKLQQTRYAWLDHLIEHYESMGD